MNEIHFPIHHDDETDPHQIMPPTIVCQNCGRDAGFVAGVTYCEFCCNGDPVEYIDGDHYLNGLPMTDEEYERWVDDE